MIIKLTENKLLFSTLKGKHSFDIGWKDIDIEIALGMRISVEEARKIREGEITLSDPRRLYLFNEIFKYRLFDLFNLCSFKMNTH
jgi:hypothetical protein